MVRRLRLGLSNTQTPIAGLVAAAGPIKIVTDAGDLRVESSVTANGAHEILLETRDVAGADVIMEADVSTQGGHITILSTDDIQQAVTGDISSNGGDIFLQAINLDGKRHRTGNDS